MINYNKDYSKKNPSKKYKELVELYKELHSNSSKIFDGRSLIKFANPIREIIKKHNTLRNEKWKYYRKYRKLESTIKTMQIPEYVNKIVKNSS